MDILLASLTETQILSEIRKAFTGETLTDIDLHALIEQSTTLQELFNAIQSFIAVRNSKSLS